MGGGLGFWVPGLRLEGSGVGTGFFGCCKFLCLELSGCGVVGGIEEQKRKGGGKGGMGNDERKIAIIKRLISW